MTSFEPQCVPFLQVTDARSSAAFYCTALGFHQEWIYQVEPHLPAVASVRRDGIRLFLTEHPESVVGALVYFYIDDVDQLAQAVTVQGVALEWAPEDTSWGTREMQLCDPDGNRLRFGTLRAPERE